MTITEPAAAPNSREPLLFVSELEFVASRFIGAAVGELGRGRRPQIAPNISPNTMKTISRAISLTDTALFMLCAGHSLQAGNAV